MEYVDIDVIRAQNGFAIPIQRQQSELYELLISHDFAIIDKCGIYYDYVEEMEPKQCQTCRKQLLGPYWISEYDEKIFCNACHIHVIRCYTYDIIGNVDLKLISLTNKISKSAFYMENIGYSMLDWEICEKEVDKYKLICKNEDSPHYQQNAIILKKENMLIFSRFHAGSA